MTLLMHQRYVRPRINCKSMTVGLKRSIQDNFNYVFLTSRRQEVGLVVMAQYSRSKGHRFGSHHGILDGCHDLAPWSGS